MKQLFTLIILCPFFALAQSNYKPGYVVTLKGDTIKGLVNYKDWGKNPKQIGFKTNLNASKTETYSTANASAFAVNGYEYYKRYTGSISEDAVETNYLSRGIDTTSKTDTVFLRAISRGKNVTLYEYADVLKERYFISGGNSTPVELAYHVFFDPAVNAKVSKQRGYMQQLQSLALTYQPQNASLAEEISNINYTAEEIKKIVAEINGGGSGTPSSGTSFTAENHGGARLFIGLGVDNTNVRFTGSNDFTSLGASSSIFPEINFGADLFLNKDVGNLIIRTTLSITGDKPSFTYTSTGSFPYTTVLNFNQYSAMLQPQLLYNIYNTNPMKFYLSAGFSINLSKYTKMVYYRTNANGTTTPGSIISITEPIQPRPVSFSGVTKIGLVLSNKIDINIGYTLPYLIDNESLYGIQSASFHVGVNYLFGK
jgi:hypothetical protein